jgi:hypothetical protein
MANQYPEGLREGWSLVAKELRLYERCSPALIREFRLMFMSGAMYAATHRHNMEAIFEEGMKEFDLFDKS